MTTFFRDEVKGALVHAAGNRWIVATFIIFCVLIPGIGILLSLMK